MTHSLSANFALFLVIFCGCGPQEVTLTVAEVTRIVGCQGPVEVVTHAATTRGKDTSLFIEGSSTGNPGEALRDCAIPYHRVDPQVVAAPGFAPEWWHRNCAILEAFTAADGPRRLQVETCEPVQGQTRVFILQGVVH